MITFLNGKLFQKLSEKVILDCRIDSNPKSEINWYKGESKLASSFKYHIENLDDSNSRLHINVNLNFLVLIKFFIFFNCLLELGKR